MDLRFENDVKMYGIQTVFWRTAAVLGFENDVKMYGIQTIHINISADTGLRMM